MSSSIFFRFKSRKDALQINFDGTSLSVFEVKREIMSIARLGDGKDFDLDIYTSDTNELYDDDTTQIPRSTTVIARRLPAQRPGAGRASRYVTGHMPLHARNSHRVESSAKAANKATASNGAMGDGAAMTEEEKLKAVLNASNNQLKADLQNSSGKPVIRNNKAAAVPDKPLPPGYMCHRCGKSGHWIQACPTNNDPNFDGKHKFKRTTGIPKSFHVAVDTEHAIGEDGQVDPTKLGKGVMYTQDGVWVRAKTDEATWQKLQEQQAAQAEKAKQAAQGDQELRDRGLECPIDKRPFVEPHKTPCCGKTYCLTCIENSLLDNDLICPNCGEQALIDKLEPDDEATKKLAEFEDEKKAEKIRKDKEASKSPAAGTPKPEDAKSPSAAAPDVKVEGADSPASTTSNSKKRPAEEELENKRRPSNPAEMKKTPSNQGTPAGPSSSNTPQPQQAQPPKGPKNMQMQDFVQQMNAMAGGMPNGANANPMMNGMPPMGPMGMNMGMGMNMNMMGMMNQMGMGMPPNFNNMNMMNQMGGSFPMNGGMNGMNGGGMGWQGNPQQQQPPWMRNGGMQNQQGGDGAYFRQPVNPHRAQGRQRRQRSVDYKQM
ncbi:hypothetical protein M409DRAFT_70297 [Zasmidium cellare ATCC 36951]|uniref:DWNN domain-containing protein n=1 Tax=Zasmidium cellare ATCC 36951 TaxID=1080233 RepID=A0A6A6C3U3_ZASCE|nr:uncharacterized protein M409DRAFT_70297 [Zasmidium cellare ATCC 36951]KAF2160532.1 hypothetical protein M409DRAFT_70297 [Zasmidium cellare ATCC 36951]